VEIHWMDMGIIDGNPETGRIYDNGQPELKNSGNIISHTSDSGRECLPMPSDLILFTDNDQCP
jgi:hypothetical protein